MTAALLLAVGGFSSPATAQAAKSSTHARVVTVAASSGWMVYKRQVSGKNLSTYPQKGDALYATNEAGTVTHLTGFDDSHRVHIVTNTVEQATRTSDASVYQERIRSWDLLAGTSRLITGKVGDRLVAGAPEGWVVSRSTGQVDKDGSASLTLAKIGIDGSETALGSPFPDGEHYGIVASDAGLIATPTVVDEEPVTSTVRFMSWFEPGQWQTVYQGGAVAHIQCAPASNTNVACEVRNPGKGLVTLSLIGGAPHWLKNTHPTTCQNVEFVTVRTHLLALETTDAGRCTKGLVYRFGGDKKLATSVKKFGVQGTITASMDGILVSKGQQQVVYRLAGVTRAPTVLARAR